MLLAPYADFSVTKDRLAFGMADAIVTDLFVPPYHRVQLYINGIYNGVHLPAAQVDENSDKADAKEDFENPLSASTLFVRSSIPFDSSSRNTAPSPIITKERTNRFIAEAFSLFLLVLVQTYGFKVMSLEL